MNECNECRLVSLGLDRQAKCYVCLEAEKQKLTLDYISTVGQTQMHLEALEELRGAARAVVVAKPFQHELPSHYEACIKALAKLLEEK